MDYWKIIKSILDDIGELQNMIETFSTLRCEATEAFNNLTLRF